MKRKLMAIMMCIALSGCSASSVLPGLIGSKPEITAQAGSENIKQTVGITAKQDASSKQETTFKESAVGKVDTSNKKQVSTSSIKADNITAERIEIRNGNDDRWQMAVAFFVAGAIAGSGITALYATRRNKAA